MRRLVPVWIDLNDPAEKVLESVEHFYLQAVLDLHSGRVEVSSSHAGITRRTMCRKITKYRLIKRMVAGAEPETKMPEEVSHEVKVVGGEARGGCSPGHGGLHELPAPGEGGAAAGDVPEVRG